jgi:hypothetical protein
MRVRRAIEKEDPPKATASVQSSILVDLVKTRNGTDTTPYSLGHNTGSKDDHDQVSGLLFAVNSAPEVEVELV